MGSISGWQDRHHLYDVAIIHNITTPDVNKLINRNITRFKENVDYIDLKTGSSEELVFQDAGFSKAQLGNAKNIYLLSEREHSKSPPRT